MRTHRSYIFLTLMFLLVCLVNLPAGQEGKQRPTPQDGNRQPTPQELVREGVRELLKAQEKGGVWPYECTIPDNVQVEGPLGSRVGSTAIVAEALLFAAPADKEAVTAVQRALAYVLDKLSYRKMEANTKKGYNDMRVWGHGYALEFLCHVRARKLAGPQAEQVSDWISRLVKTLLEEEMPGGGWNYSPGPAPATFTTAPVTQSLLLARSQGEKVPDEVFERARDVLERARSEQGAFGYESERRGKDGSKPPLDNTFGSVPGSAGRSAVCETTLALLGGSSSDAARMVLNNFHLHWDKLEARRRKPDNHGGKYGIAPYYFYFAHRYAAQAIQLLPAEERAKERERLLKLILQTRNKEGTWNDCVYRRACNFGTAMVIVALLGDEMPLPPKLAKK